MNKRHIHKFDFNNMGAINNYIVSRCDGTPTCKELEHLLSTENVSFVLSGINRLQSTLLCEECASYVQQSQRYVPVTAEYICLLDNTPDELRYAGMELVTESFKLYTDMTVLRDPNKKGRPLVSDFVHGIPYEDGRIMLPLAFSTNLVVSMPADKLIGLFGLFFKYNLVFESLYREFRSIIPAQLLNALTAAATRTFDRLVDATYAYFEHKFNDISLSRPVVMFDSINNVAIAALASQNKESPVIVYESWGDNKDVNSQKLINNVLGYTHYGINEHARTTFGMTCSLATYHQVIRHRLQNIRREPFKDIITGQNREYVIPKSIRSNQMFFPRSMQLIEKYRDFYKKYSAKYDIQFIMQFMLSAAAVKFVVSSNIRNDNNIFRDRLCNTAQEEIRELYFMKFMILHKMFPDLVKYGVPPCVVSGKCKEGRLTCGDMQSTVDRFSDYI